MTLNYKKYKFRLVQSCKSTIVKLCHLFLIDSHTFLAVFKFSSFISQSTQSRDQILVQPTRSDGPIQLLEH